MRTALIVLVLLALALTVGSLAWGLISMSKGGESDRKHSHEFMFARVAFHAVAVGMALLALYLFVGP